MAQHEYWIQLEVIDEWDMAPNHDRMTGMAYSDKLKRKKNVLVYRRYSQGWRAPRDSKVNPWDIYEPDPAGGTIPGPTIECKVGDSVVVHFRNADRRYESDEKLTALDCTHSVHTHGITFGVVYDGAYPLSPHDTKQTIPATEKKAWAAIGLDQFTVGGKLFKRGDRVPPGGTFTYQWDTLGWPSTAGVWMYHDHSIHDVMNVRRGAIGFLVIRNTEDPGDVEPDAPAGLILDEHHKVLLDPPQEALVLQLYHELHTGSGSPTMAINGRIGLGNTPSILLGPTTKARFGVGAMNYSTFHTFHIHGHRWLVPGPSGVVGAVGHGATVSPANVAVSAFEDTRILGPAESFAFTIQEGGPMGPPPGAIKGEWHMHCHVMMHMMTGRGAKMRSAMMGSLIIAERGDVLPLESGGHHMHESGQS